MSQFVDRLLFFRKYQGTFAGGHGVVTDEMICADLGVDWEDVYEQRAREAARRQKLGLPEGDTLAPDPVGDKLVTEDADA